MSAAPIRVPPFWRIYSRREATEDRGVLHLGGGEGFGDGSHETTQLCLQAIAAFAPKTSRRWRMLDVGTGNGVLAIAAAKLGADVVAVEIDAAARLTAAENTELNKMGERVKVLATLDAAKGTFGMVVSNISGPVLLGMVQELVAHVSAGGVLVLTGLLATDVPSILAGYAPFTGGQRPSIHPLGEWRALAWTSLDVPNPLRDADLP